MGVRVNSTQTKMKFRVVSERNGVLYDGNNVIIAARIYQMSIDIDMRSPVSMYENGSVLKQYTPISTLVPRRGERKMKMRVSTTQGGTVYAGDDTKVANETFADCVKKQGHAFHVRLYCEDICIQHHRPAFNMMSKGSVGN